MDTSALPILNVRGCVGEFPLVRSCTRLEVSEIIGGCLGVVHRMFRIGGPKKLRLMRFTNILTAITECIIIHLPV